MSPIAFFRSPFISKFGAPRQSGVVDELRGSIVLEPEYRDPDIVRGLEGFDYIWLIWGFSANDGAAPRHTVRPPRLGGNERMGVFATRSPFRPNGLGLSSVRLERVEMSGRLAPVIHVRGADLIDRTPIYDIKPYLPSTDSHPEARSGFADATEWRRLSVALPPEAARQLGEEAARTLTRTLEEDPRPRYHDDPSRVYAMDFGPWTVRFSVQSGVALVREITARQERRK